MSELGVDSSGRRDAVEFINALIGAFDCCGTCAGGVLAQHDREVAARTWDEGWQAGMAEAYLLHKRNTDDGPTANPYSTLPTQPDPAPTEDRGLAGGA